MRNIVKQNSIFIGLCLLSIIIIGVVLLCVPKAELHLWLNQYHSPFLNGFFRGYTVLAEWVPYVFVVLLLFYRFGWSAFLLANLLISGLIGQGLKYLFDTDRPLTWFANNYPDIQLQLVDGVHMSKFYSCPSGHTITFFVLFFTLCIIITNYFSVESTYKTTKLSKNIATQVVCFLLALTGAYSRIYLSQHFAVDIWAGIIIALLVTILLSAFLPLISDKKWYKMHFFAKKTQKNLVD